jgi:hypothetical protein
VAADAQVWVNPHTRSNGTQVPGHYRTAPDSSLYNNWGTYPNVNRSLPQFKSGPRNQVNKGFTATTVCHWVVEATFSCKLP